MLEHSDDPLLFLRNCRWSSNIAARRISGYTLQSTTGASAMFNRSALVLGARRLKCIPLIPWDTLITDPPFWYSNSRVYWRGASANAPSREGTGIP